MPTKQRSDGGCALGGGRVPGPHLDLRFVFPGSLFTVACTLFLVLGGLPAMSASLAQAQALTAAGSLPEVGKRINQLIYPTFGNPSIVARGGELTIEWDWRKGALETARPALAQVDGAADWEVWATTSLAANVQNYDSAVPGTSEDPPASWYRYGGPSYGTYANPVHSVVNTRSLAVKSVARGPSLRWPEIFGQAGFEVDHITVEVPAGIPLDLYDLHVRCVSTAVAPEFRVEDMQPHALQVVDGYDGDLKIVQITDTHVFGPETRNGLNLDYNSFELREPRPGTPDRIDLSFVGYPGFPMDKDMDGKSNEGAIYLQEELQAINLIDPDFVVFTGDSVFSQKNFSTYPKDTWLWGDVNGELGSEYRFEYTWWYDELLALNVPIFCVPGNHDSYCWDGHAVAHDDGQEIWQDLFGPLYYSWDYGDASFLAVNSMDWDKVDADGPETFVPEDVDPICLEPGHQPVPGDGAGLRRPQRLPGRSQQLLHPPQGRLPPQVARPAAGRRRSLGVAALALGAGPGWRRLHGSAGLGRGRAAAGGVRGQGAQGGVHPPRPAAARGLAARDLR